jgi:hypothetical protein
MHLFDAFKLRYHVACMQLWQERHRLLATAALCAQFLLCNHCWCRDVGYAGGGRDNARQVMNCKMFLSRCDAGQKQGSRSDERDKQFRVLQEYGDLVAVLVA